MTTLQPPPRRNSRGGISLLEILVVMAIISTLFAIMTPSMFHFIKYVRHLGH